MLEQEATPDMISAREQIVSRSRLSISEDHAKALLFPVSDPADYTCGVAPEVDGGSL